MEINYNFVNIIVKMSLHMFSETSLFFHFFLCIVSLVSHLFI